MATAEPVGSKEFDEGDVRWGGRDVVLDAIRLAAFGRAADYLQVDKGLAGVPVRRPCAACAISRVRVWIFEMAQALRLTALGMQSGRQLSISDSEADKLVMLPWVTILTRAKLAQGGEACDINVVVDDSVRLLDNDDAGVWARKAPKNHGRRPKGSAIIDLERQALLVTPQVLEAVWEEVGSFPVAKTDDIAHVSEVVRETMKRWSEVAREGAESGSLEGTGKGARELAGDEHGWRVISAEKGLHLLESERSRRRRCNLLSDS